MQYILMQRITIICKERRRALHCVYLIAFKLSCLLSLMCYVAIIKLVVTGSLPPWALSHNCMCLGG